MQKLLTPLQRKALLIFQKSKLNTDFYWTGGTLLSYHYLQHRDSEDLDFFSDQLFFDDYMASEFLIIKKILNAQKMHERKHLNRNQLVFECGKQSLKMEFVYFPFPPLAKHIRLPEFGIAADSLKDIAVNKLHASFQRSEPKDIFDLYWIIKKGHFKFLDLFKWFEKKFGSTIDPVTYAAKIISDIPLLDKLRPLIRNKKFFQPELMKSFFETEALTYLKKKIK